MILQGMVLLLVLIHPLVSQTGDLVCIRAFFRVEGKAAAGADRQKTACNILTDKLDLAAGRCRGHCANRAVHGVYFFQRPYEEAAWAIFYRDITAPSAAPEENF